jgi:outer membrane protein TolC
MMRKFIWAAVAAACALQPFFPASAERPATAGPVLTLQDALALAGPNQPRIEAFEREAQASQEAAVAARSLPDLQVTAGVQNFPFTGPNAFSPTDDFMTMYVIGVMREQVRRSKREAESQKILAEALVSKRQADAEERNIRLSVMTAWIDAVEAHQKAILLTRLADDLQTGRSVMQSGVSTGHATPATVLRMESEIALVKGDLAQVKSDEDRARAELGRWVGADAASRPLPDALPLIEAPEAVPANMLRLDTHPTIEVAEAERQAASRAAEAARQETKPDISWSVMAGFRPKFGNMISGTVSIPLQLNRGNKQDRLIAEARLRADAAALRAEDTRRDLMQRYRAARAQFEGANAELTQIDREAVPALESAFNAAEARYESGGGTSEEPFQIVQRYIETTIKSVDTRAKRDRAAAEIIYILGETQT